MDPESSARLYTESVSVALPQHILWMKREFEEGEEYTIFAWDHPSTSGIEEPLAGADLAHPAAVAKHRGTKSRVIKELRGVLHASIDVMRTLSGWPAHFMMFDWETRSGEDSTIPYTAAFIEMHNTILVVAYDKTLDWLEADAAVSWLFDCWTSITGSSALYCVIPPLHRSTDDQTVVDEHIPLCLAGWKVLVAALEHPSSTGSTIAWEASWATPSTNPPEPQFTLDLVHAVHSELDLLWGSVRTTSTITTGKNVLLCDPIMNGVPAPGSILACCATDWNSPDLTILDIVGSASASSLLRRWICLTPAGRAGARGVNIKFDRSALAAALASIDPALTALALAENPEGVQVEAFGVLQMQRLTPSASPIRQRSPDGSILTAAFEAVVSLEEGDKLPQDAGCSVLGWASLQNYVAWGEDSTVPLRATMHSLIRVSIPSFSFAIFLLAYAGAPIESSGGSSHEFVSFATADSKAVTVWVIESVLSLLQVKLRVTS
jgi:hypothetical protein